MEGGGQKMFWDKVAFAYDFAYNEIEKTMKGVWFKGCREEMLWHFLIGRFGDGNRFAK